jgi:hypothetical protein
MTFLLKLLQANLSKTAGKELVKIATAKKNSSFLFLVRQAN